jgi:two-component system response regulator HydG
MSDKSEVDAKESVLVVDDDPSMCELLGLMFRQHGLDVEFRTSGLDALELVAERDFDVTLTDLEMPAIPGNELCQRLLELRPGMPVILLTGNTSFDAAVSAIRAGAYDFVTKPVDAKLLMLVIRRALSHVRLHREVKRLRLEVGDTQRVGRLLGESPAMKRVLDLVARVADSGASVLVTGESGTGKELIARAVHEQSQRRDGPFLAVNCAAMPAALLESELFGHARGAFTDAKISRTGLFESASGGTLFLDEIGDMPIEMQAKLLRALQERTVRPVGSNVDVAFDARIVTATNRDLDADVTAKRFREDLYYRINVVRVDSPPLRERGGDVLLLAAHFVARFAKRGDKAVRGIHAMAAEKLMAYDWPGNVRELENCMERAVALLRFDEVTVDDLPEKIRRYRADRLVLGADDITEVVTIDELERRYIMRVLALCGGNKSRTADLLGVDRRTLYRRIERYAAES